MYQRFFRGIFCVGLILVGLVRPVFAGEGLFSSVRLAETLPQGEMELIQSFKQRSDKGRGTYKALNSVTELEYGVSNRFQFSGGIQAQSIEHSGLIVDGYLPKNEHYGLSLSGFELAAKYNFLSPAASSFGLASFVELDYSSLDPHSGQGKDTWSMSLGAITQKYLLEGRLIWAGNLALESTIADRHSIEGLPEGFEWPTFPEVEIEFKLSTGLSYRFIPKWYAGFEFLYEEEHETEVGQERYSMFVGPTLHYGGKKYWVSASYLSQLYGGGEKYDGQSDTDLHLIEKTKSEFIVSLGMDF